MEFQFNHDSIGMLMDAARMEMETAGRGAEEYYAPFMAAAKLLQLTIYPKMGVMVIPTLGDSPK